MWDRLNEIRDRVGQLEEELADPEVTTRPERLAELSRRHAELVPVAQAMRAYETARRTVDEAQELAAGAADPEERAFYDEQRDAASADAERLEAELALLLLPKDPDDSRNVILELRGAAGGDESSLFAADLVRMYTLYAEGHGWEAALLSSAPTAVGGLREAVLEIRGTDVWSRLKYEGGTHRVQRVPETEASGRIHTSTVTVAVLPEAEDVEVAIAESDLRIDRFRSSGPGGQSVNTTDSAIRVTHVPTGLVVQCQDQKSQLQNKEKALRHLRSLLRQVEEERRHAEIAADRRAQVGTGERSEKIRTYNFPQSRVTDHRIGLSVHNLPAVLNGELDEVVDALAADERARLLGEQVPMDVAT